MVGVILGVLGEKFRTSLKGVLEKVKLEFVLPFLFIGLYFVHAAVFLALQFYRDWFLSYGASSSMLLSHEIWIIWAAGLSICVGTLPFLLLILLIGYLL